MSELPNDQFKRYYAEKLWDWIPLIYRHEDAIADSPGVLRAVVEVLAEQAAIVRRSSDRLWNDQYIDLCDDWAVPYIADLVGTRLVSALDTRARRIDVAKTIYYRRRAGTLAVLAELIADIAGCEGSVVEEFRRLARTPHGLDEAPAARGRLTGTPAHALPDMRSPRGVEAQATAWDEWHYLPDMRRNKGGLDGRYGVTKLGFHLFRLAAFEVSGVTPRALKPQAGKVRFAFDPSGRAVPLFQRRNRPDFEADWRPALQWELPMPIRCEVLSHAEFEITEALVLSWQNPPLSIVTAAEADILRTLRGIRFANEQRLRRRLTALFVIPLGAVVLHRILADALVADCAKAVLLPGGSPGADGFDPSIEVDVPVLGTLTPVAREMTVAGNLTVGVRSPIDKTLVVDAESGLGYFIAGTVPTGTRVTYHYGFAGKIGAGAYDRGYRQQADPPDQRSGGGAIAAVAAADVLMEIIDNANYGPVAAMPVANSLAIRAADFQRPYIELASDWTITATQSGSTLLLDGLWLSSKANRTVKLSAAANCSWKSVVIKHCTFDPGGADADGVAIGAVRLVIDAAIDSLDIDACILAPVSATAAGFAETVTMRDTIVDARGAANAAIALDNGVLDIRRATVIGTVSVHQLEASELLTNGLITVADTQFGCIRFSAFPDASTAPRAYRTVSLNDSRALFTSSAFGNPAYLQLSDIAPDAIATGGESGTEIGAWCSLLNPIKLASLKAKAEEFTPLGLTAFFVTET